MNAKEIMRRPINPENVFKMFWKDENPAMDSLVTREIDGEVEVLLITRPDGKVAFPGGFINSERFNDFDGGELATANAKIFEETGLVESKEKKLPVTFMSADLSENRSPVNDPRADDQSLITTKVAHKHFGGEEAKDLYILNSSELTDEGGGDKFLKETEKIAWYKISFKEGKVYLQERSQNNQLPEFPISDLYANHGEILSTEVLNKPNIKKLLGIENSPEGINVTSPENLEYGERLKILASMMHSNWQDNIREKGIESVIKFYADYQKFNPETGVWENKTGWINESDIGENLRVIKEYEGKKVDLLDCPFTKLPPHWQQENLAQARTVYKLINENFTKIQKSQNNKEELDIIMKSFAEVLHRDFSKRNPKHNNAKIEFDDLGSQDKDNNYKTITAAFELMHYKIVTSEQVKQMIELQGEIYRKFGKVKATKPEPGTIIKTVLKRKNGAVMEVQRIARKDDWLIEAIPTGEKYLIPNEKFLNSYKEVSGETDIYEAFGLRKFAGNDFAGKVVMLTDWGEYMFGDKDCMFGIEVKQSPDGSFNVVTDGRPYIIGGEERLNTYNLVE